MLISFRSFFPFFLPQLHFSLSLFFLFSSPFNHLWNPFYFNFFFLILFHFSLYFSENLQFYLSIFFLSTKYFHSLICHFSFFIYWIFYTPHLFSFSLFFSLDSFLYLCSLFIYFFLSLLSPFPFFHIFFCLFIIFPPFLPSQVSSCHHQIANISDT